MERWIKDIQFIVEYENDGLAFLKDPQPWIRTKSLQEVKRDGKLRRDLKSLMRDIWDDLKRTDRDWQGTR